MPAAVTDYRPAPHDGKIPSGKEGLTMRLEPLPKVASEVTARFPDCHLVAFKAESGVTPEELEARARRRLDELGALMIVANDLDRVEGDRTTAFILNRSGGRDVYEGGKDGLARRILDAVAREVAGGLDGAGDAR
jgi:phosphopantothenoylcysteine synthetase/decarboxylase